MDTFEVKNEKGEVLIELEASIETVAAIIFLIEQAVKADREKLAAWMFKHHFATGHGDTLDDLLSELSWQIAELRLRTASTREEVREILATIPRKELTKAGIV